MLSLPTITKPTIYLAGKIKPAARDWRFQLVRGRIDLGMDDEKRLFDPSYVIEEPLFFYGGPYYVACDHQCGHGTANHGVGASGDRAGCISGFWGDEQSTPRRVFEVNRRRIANANVVFAFIDELDCHGTLIELSMADELGKRIVVAFGENLTTKDIRELWMARMCANAGLYVGKPVDEAWHSFLMDIAPVPTLVRQ